MGIPSQIQLWVGGIILGLWATRVIASPRTSNPKRLSLPPGPKGYPVVGSLFALSTDKIWLLYDKWFQLYGDMVYFEALGRSFLVLGSLKRTNDIFEKSNYSSRVQNFPMLLDLMGAGWAFSLMPYGATWRRHRKTFHGHFHSNIVPKYQPIQLEATRSFLRRLSATPDDFMHHIQHLFASTIMDISYGITVLDSNDPYMSIAEEVLEGFSEAAVPGAFLVDLIPILKYVPSWFPGAGFKRKAERWRASISSLLEKPYRRVIEDLKEGKARPSVLQSLIAKLPDEGDPKREEEEAMAKGVTAVAYAAGSDTTIAAVQAFFLTMAMHPDVQHKAQEEIDTVIGPDRLPDFNDRENLPYINAIVKETLRWHSITPIGIPHASVEDDEYDGYFIPKGTIVIGNTWTLMHDSNVFPDPLEYKPERYLKNGRLDPRVRSPTVAAFGFGRRICPGRSLSDSSLYVAVSNVLAVYNIKPPVDDAGNHIPLEANTTGGFLSYFTPFKCVIEPRDRKSVV